MPQNKHLIHICLSFDDFYSDPASILIGSILFNSSRADQFHFYILDGGISEVSRNKIVALNRIKKFDLTYININLEDYKDCPVNEGSHFRVINYFRLKIPSYIPDMDKILYLDTDMVVTRSLWDIYNKDISNYSLAAVPQIRQGPKTRLQIPAHFSLINSGVLLINCAAWRRKNIEKRLFNFIKSSPPEKLMRDFEAVEK